MRGVLEPTSVLNDTLVLSTAPFTYNACQINVVWIDKRRWQVRRLSARGKSVKLALSDIRLCVEICVQGRAQSDSILVSSHY